VILLNYSPYLKGMVDGGLKPALFLKRSKGEVLIIGHSARLI